MAEHNAEKGGLYFDPPRRPSHPCEHGHRWAWAQLVSGGTRQVCRVCGRERRR